MNKTIVINGMFGTTVLKGLIPENGGVVIRVEPTKNAEYSDYGETIQLELESVIKLRKFLQLAESRLTNKGYVCRDYDGRGQE